MRCVAPQVEVHIATRHDWAEHMPELEALMAMLAEQLPAVMDRVPGCGDSLVPALGACPPSA